MALRSPSRTSRATRSVPPARLTIAVPSSRPSSLEVCRPSDAPSAGNPLPGALPSQDRGPVRSSRLVAGFHTRFGPPPPFSTTLTVCPSPHPVTYFSHSRPWGSVSRLPVGGRYPCWRLPAETFRPATEVTFRPAPPLRPPRRPFRLRHPSPCAATSIHCLPAFASAFARRRRPRLRWPSSGCFAAGVAPCSRRAPSARRRPRPGPLASAPCEELPLQPGDDPDPRFTEHLGRSYRDQVSPCSLPKQLARSDPFARPACAALTSPTFCVCRLTVRSPSTLSAEAGRFPVGGLWPARGLVSI
jgi:hypothetical protein